MALVQLVDVQRLPNVNQLHEHSPTPAAHAPRPGHCHPAQTSATDGDALDNVLFVEGPDRAFPFLARRPSTEALFFLPKPGGKWKLVRHGR